MRYLLLISVLSFCLSITSVHATSCDDFWSLHEKYVKIVDEQHIKARAADKSPELSCKYAREEGVPAMKGIVDGAAEYSGCPGNVGTVASKFVNSISKIVQAYEKEFTEKCARLGM